MKSALFYSNLKFSHSAVTLFCGSLGIFIISLLFAPLYSNGDQIGYTNAYNSVFGEDLVYGLEAYKGHISSSEPIHYLIVFMTSNLGLEKNLVMAISNSILAYLIMRVFLQWRVSAYVSLALIFTNFYVLVLYFSGERLKFGFIFLMLSLLYSRQRKLSFFFAITAILAHSQQILFYVITLFSSAMTAVSYFLKKGKFHYKQTLMLIVFIFIAFALFYFMGGHILGKLEIYNTAAQENSLFSLWRTLILFLLTLQYSAARLNIISSFSILLLAVVFVGPERINMISYCYFLFYALQYKRGVNVGVAFTSIYFCFKSIDFILNVFETGQGFS
jgi:hypothetical protein